MPRLPSLVVFTSTWDVDIDEIEKDEPKCTPSIPQGSKYESENESQTQNLKYDRRMCALIAM